MATTLTLSDGTTTIDLNTGSITSGITLESIRLPEVQRQVARVSSFPYIDGSRTVASALDDSRVEILCHIRGTSADDVESQFMALTNLLEQAQRWELSRTGSPVRLAFKRNGVMNTAYWVVTSASPPGLAGDPERLPNETKANMLRLRLLLMLEPVAHTGTLTTIGTLTTLTNQPSFNTMTTSAVMGDMAGPVTIEIVNKQVGNNWTQIWLVEQRDVPIKDDFSGTVDGDAYGGQASTIAVTGSPSGLFGSSGATTVLQWPLRVFARLKVTAGTASKLQIRARMQYGQTVESYTPWTTFAGISGNYYLMDLGSLAALPHLALTTMSSAVPFSLQYEFKTSDGSVITAVVDYFETIPYRGVVKITSASTGNTDHVIYEDALTSGTFVWPRQSPAVYQTDSLLAFRRALQRYGRLLPAEVGPGMSVWVAAQSATLHRISEQLDMTIKHLPCYALGLRGAG